MPNAIGWIALVIASATVGAVLADLRGRRIWAQLGTSLVRQELQASAEKLTRAKEEAFERAAQAVSLWPHRIDRRVDLARHLLSLATAPALGVASLNPEATAVEASVSSDTPAPSAAPVPASEDVLDTPQDDERVIDVYRQEGLL